MQLKISCLSSPLNLKVIICMFYSLLCPCYLEQSSPWKAIYSSLIHSFTSYSLIHSLINLHDILCVGWAIAITTWSSFPRQSSLFLPLYSHSIAITGFPVHVCSLFVEPKLSECSLRRNSFLWEKHNAWPSAFKYSLKKKGKEGSKLY